MKTTTAPAAPATAALLVLLGLAALAVPAATASRADDHEPRRAPPAAPAAEEGPLDDGVFFGLALSGGGYRAAAFGWGVTRALQSERLDEARGTLLDRVDVISAVSGGGFLASWLVTHHDEADAVARFGDEVLARNMETELAGAALKSTFALMKRDTARSDVAAAHYDATLLGGATIGGLPARPRLVLNATELRSGRRFPFTPEALACLGVDADTFGVGKALAATSAFPVALTPIVLPVRRHLPHACDGRHEPAPPGEDGEPPPPAAHAHLADGGIVDNLGLLDLIARLDAIAGADAPAHAVIVIVNARRGPTARDDEDGAFAGDSTAGPYAVTHRTVELLQRQVDALLVQRTHEAIGRLALRAHAAGRRCEKHVVVIDADSLPEERAAALSAVGTRLKIDAEQAEELSEASAGLLRQDGRLAGLARIWTKR